MKDLDIKEVWKGADEAVEASYSEQHINKIIRRGSQNLIQKFIRTVACEKWINVAVLTGLAAYAAYGAAWVVTAGALVANVLFFVYYQNLGVKLKREKVDTSVLQYLYNVQSLVRQFIRHYKIATLVLCPIAVMAAYYLNEIGFYGDPENSKSFLIGITIGLVLAVPFTYYLIFIVYGKKSQKLSQMIESLENDEQ